MYLLALSLLVACSPVSGIYTTTQTTAWTGTCDTSGFPAEGSAGSLGVEVDPDAMTISDSSGDFPCELTGDTFTCELLAQEQQLAVTALLISTLSLDGAWTSSFGFDATFNVDITCDGAGCAGSGVEDCSSSADIEAELG